MLIFGSCAIAVVYASFQPELVAHYALTSIYRSGVPGNAYVTDPSPMHVSDAGLQSSLLPSQKFASLRREDNSRVAQEATF